MVDKENKKEENLKEEKEKKPDKTQTQEKEAEVHIKKEQKEKKKAENKSDEADITKKELAEQKDKYLRLVAEYDNFRKRTAKEKSETFGDATVKAITDILPIYDNFERALASESTDENFKKGIEMIFKQFGDALNKMGVEEINPVGEEFNPDVAQAVNQVQDDNFGDNVVCQVFQKGYKLGDKIIRYAMVVVANP